MLKSIGHFLGVVVSGLYLLLAWIWHGLGRIISAFIHWLPLKSLTAAIEAWLHTLPPYGALFMLLVPYVAVDIPLKFLTLYLLTQRELFAAIVAEIASKLFSIGIISALYKTTRLQLLQIGWFKKLYEVLSGWEQWARRLFDPAMQKVKRFVAKMWPWHTR